jgi:signal transduction histidine kinase
VAELPSEVQVPSHVRHNLVLAVKEAVHNVIKHAAATELTVRVDWQGGELTILVQDNGRAFDLRSRPEGNGLGNMQRRLAQVGGSCALESREGQGTTVIFKTRIQPAG